MRAVHAAARRDGGDVHVDRARVAGRPQRAIDGLAQALVHGILRERHAVGDAREVVQVGERRVVDGSAAQRRASSK
jgi:hypothetical protein